MRTWSAGIAVVFSLLVGLAAPGAAWAGDAYDEPAPTPVKVSKEPKQAQVRTCSLYANSAGFGMSCVDGSKAGKSLKALLGGDPFRECWHEPAPVGFVPPETPPGPGRWWVETCLRGIDPKTLERTGPVLLEQRPVFLAPGREVFLTGNQRALLRAVYSWAYPDPLLGFGPSASPRVNTDVFFWVVRGRSVLPERTVDPGTGPVAMRASLVQLAVQPTGSAGPVVRCAGRGVEVHAVIEPELVPGSCHHRYTHSSARGPRGEYVMPVTAYWRVEYSDGGAGWTELGTFARTTVQRLRVTEIQTLVVP